jgi:hypothetical protein
MANRKDRRAAKKALPRYQRIMTPEQQKAALIKNGITPADLKKEWDAGYRAGLEAYLKSSYAAACLALHDLHGFGYKRCKAFLQAMDNHLLYSLTDLETINEVWERIGLKLVFNDPLDRIQDGDQDA